MWDLLLLDARVATLRGGRYAPIERYRFRDVTNWYFAPAEIAAAANARETDRGRGT